MGEGLTDYQAKQIIAALRGIERSIVYVGDRQRKLITHYPGVEIFECLPWDYEKRVKP